jgi:hypothetical protein
MPLQTNWRLSLPTRGKEPTVGSFKFWLWEPEEEKSARETQTFVDLATNFLNKETADAVYEAGSNLWNQATQAASGAADAVTGAASRAWEASAPAPWRPGTPEYQGYQQDRDRFAQRGGAFDPANTALSHVNQGLEGASDLLMGDALSLGGRFVGELAGIPNVGQIVPQAKDVPLVGQDLAEANPAAILANVLPLPGRAGRITDALSGVMPAAGAAARRVPGIVGDAVEAVTRQAPPEGFAAPGELTQLKREQLPNRDIFESAGWAFNETEGNAGFMPPGGKSQASVDQRMQVWQQIEPNPRIPTGLQNDDMERFLDDLSRLRSGLVTGETKPESQVLGSLLAIASVNRGGTSYAKTLRTLTKTTGRDAEELAARVQPDIYYQKGGAKQESGINIRPEIIWSMIAGDTTDPMMMRMLVGIARPDSFANPVERQKAVTLGVEELYRRLRGTDAGGEKIAETIHGDFGNPQSILGYPTMREGQVRAGGAPWHETEPERVNEMGRIARAVEGQAEEGSPYAGMAGEDLRVAAMERLLDRSPRGIGPTKTRFTASMTALPEYATLDTRMLRDVYGISPAASSILTFPEYEFLSSKLRGLGSNTKYLYGQQWLPWEFLTGEKTTYNSLSGIYDNLNRFMGQAEQLARQTRRPIGDVVGELAENEQRVNIELSDPEQVQARIGLAFRPLAASPEGLTGREARIRSLMPGAGSGEVDKAFPELKKLAEDAGLRFADKRSVAAGGWKNDAGSYYTDKTFDVTLEGPKPAVRWFTSAMMMGLPDEEAALITYRGAGANLKDYEGSMLVRNLTREQYEAYSRDLSDAFPGWTMTMKPRKLGGQVVYDAIVSSVATGDEPESDRVLMEGMRALSSAFQKAGHAVKLGELEPVEAEFLGRDQILEVVRGGPRGARVVPGRPDQAGPGGIGPHDGPGGGLPSGAPEPQAPGGGFGAVNDLGATGRGTPPGSAPGADAIGADDVRRSDGAGVTERASSSAPGAAPGLDDLPSSSLGAIQPGAEVTETSARLAREAAAADAANPRTPGRPYDDTMATFRDIPKGEAVNRTRTPIPGSGDSREVSAEDLAPGGGRAREMKPGQPRVGREAREVGAEDLVQGGGSAREVRPRDPRAPSGSFAREVEGPLDQGGSAYSNARDVTPGNAGQADPNVPAFSVQRYAGQPTGSLGPQPAPNPLPKGSALGKLENSIQWEPTKGERTTVRGGITEVIRQLFDNTVPLRHITESYQKVVGRPLSVAEDAWKLLRLSRGSEAAAEQFREQYLAPAVKGLDDQGIHDLNLILKANDAIDKQRAISADIDEKLIKRIAKRENAPEDPLLLKLKNHAPLIERARQMGQHNFSGMKADDAQAALSELEQRVGPQAWADLQKRADQVWDMGHRLLAYKAKQGLIDGRAAADLVRDYPHYSPIRIVEWLQDQADNARGGIGNTLAVRGNGLAKLTAVGTDKSALPPLDAYVQAVSSAYALGARNEAGRALIRYFKEVPDLAELIRPANKEALAFVESMRGDKLGKRAPGETTFSVYENGQKLEFYVDKQLKQALEINGPDWMKDWHPVLSAPLKASAEMLRAGATGANVLFMLPNAIGDAMTYFIRNGGVPSLPKNAAYLARGYKSSFLKDADYQRMIKAGGGQSGFYSGGSDIFKKDKIKGYAGRISTSDQLLGVVKDLATFKPVKELGQRFEEATRMAEFHRLAKEGDRAAALGARDVTIDFARGGLLTKAVNGLVPFFNVGFQAPAQTVRMLKDEKTRGKALMGIATMVIAPTLALEAYNRQYGELYADVPQYVKDRGLVIMLPDQPESPDPETGRPIPRYMVVNMREWAPFAVATREAVSRMVGDDTRTWGEFAQALLKNTSPIEPNANAIGDIMPPVLKVGAELTTNHNFFTDRPIVPDSMKNLPPEEQYTSQTSEVAKLAGKALGASPMKLEHGFTGLTAGVGRQALAAGDLALKAAGVTESPDRKMAAIEKQLGQSGINPEKRAKLERERDRLLAAKGNRDQLVREQPILGGLASAAGFKEQGGELERRASLQSTEKLEAAKGTDLGKELDRLGLELTEVKPQIEGVYLDRKRASTYQSRATAFREDLLSALVESPVYQTASDAEKARLARGAMNRAADWAAQTVVPGEVKGGKEFLSKRIGGDIDKAVATYMRAIEGDQELRGLRSRRFLGINPDDADQIVEDQSALSRFRSALGDARGDMLFIQRFGAKRYARLQMLVTNPLYADQVEATKMKYPEHASIFSPDTNEFLNGFTGASLAS